MKNKVIGHIAMFMATLFFGLNIPAIKELMPKWVNAIDATYIRLAGAAIVFWIVSIFVKSEKIEKKDYLIIFLGGMVGLFSFIYFLNLGVCYSSPVDISIILTTPPVLVIIFSSIIYKTKINKLKALGIIISLAGAFMIILIGHHSGAVRSLKGNIYGGISACCYAAYLLLMKGPSQNYKAVSLLKWVFLASIILVVPLGTKSLIHSELVTNPQTIPMLIVAFVILFPTFISYLLIPIAIRSIGHEIVSMYQYLVPVFATSAAIILKMDTLQWFQPVAALIIIIGVFITSKGTELQEIKK